MKLILSIVMLLAAQTAFGKYVPTPESSMTIPLGEDSIKWQMQNMDGNREKILAEFVPQGQSIKTWREMLAQEITFTKDTLKKHLEKWMKMIKKADPEVQIEEIELSKERAIYTYRSKAFDEFSIRIFLKGSDGIYAQAYHIRLSDYSEKRVELWNNLIPKTKLVKNPVKG